jgi:hypothetical protein
MVIEPTWPRCRRRRSRSIDRFPPLTKTESFALRVLRFGRLL